MTLSAAVARDRNRAEVIFLVEIQTLASGPLLYFSDRNIVIGAVAYSDYIVSVSGLGDTLTRATGAFSNSNASITFKNDSFDAYDYLTDLSEDSPLEGAQVTIKSVFIDDDGTSATPEVIFVGALDSPTGITTIKFECACNSREFQASLTNR